MKLLKSSIVVCLSIVICSCTSRESTDHIAKISSEYEQLPIMVWKESFINIYNPDAFNEHVNSWAVVVEVSNPFSNTILLSQNEEKNGKKGGFFISYYDGDKRDTTQLTSLRKDILLLPNEKTRISLNGFFINVSSADEYILRASNILVNGELFFLNRVEENQMGMAVPSMFVGKSTNYNCYIRYFRANNMEIMKPDQ